MNNPYFKTSRDVFRTLSNIMMELFREKAPLTLPASISDVERQFNSDFYFHKGLMKVFRTFRNTTKKCENKNVSYF